MKRNKSLVILVAAIVLGLTLILVPISSQVSPAQAAITWAKYSGNPVLEEDSGEWDEGGVGAACVIEDGSTYKMWYTGLHVGPWPEIGYATSSDGKLWAKYGANPVLTKGTSGTWDDEGVGSCCVIWDADGSLYKMWYTGTPDSDFSAIPAIGYATSSDGISWAKSGSNPVLEGDAGEWDDAGVLSPCVIKESTTSYKMWYSGRAADSVLGSLQIGYATSTDGVNWVKYGTAPVLAKGTDPDWDSRGAGVGCVVEIDGSYKMWYTGYKGYKGYDEAGIEVAIGYASSRDGISWSNRSRELTKGTGWEVNGVGAPWVTYSGRTYHMWYSGLGTNFDPTLGYAYYSVPSAYEPSRPSASSPGLDVSDYVDEDGVFTEDVTAESEDGKCWVTIDESTTGLTEDGMPLSEICIILMEEPPPLPDCANIIGLVYDLAPDGAIFDPAITLCFTYNPALIPEGVAEENLVIALWDEADDEWVSLDSTVYPATNTICASVSHFTPFAVLAYTRPASFVTSVLSISPTEVDIGETVTISVSIANTGDLAGSYKVTFKINNVVVSAKHVTLAGGASQKVTFTTSKNVAGTYTVNVNGLAGSFVVKAAPAPPTTPAPTPTPLAPTPPPPTPINWWLIGGIIAAVIIIGVVVSLVVTRRKA